MPQHPRRPRLPPCLTALLLLVLTPAALSSGSRPVSSERAGTVLANALGPSHEAALVVRVVKGVGNGGGARAGRPLREDRRGGILVGLLLLLVGHLTLLLALRPPSHSFRHHLGGRWLRPRVLFAPSGPRAPPAPALP